MPEYSNLPTISPKHPLLEHFLPLFPFQNMDAFVQQLVSATRTIDSHAFIRRSANYHPSIWGEYFLALASDAEENTVSSQEQNQLYEQLKEEVRKILVATVDNSLQKLELISTIQRLGVAYQFESEIETSLQNIYHVTSDYKDEDDEALYTVALRFRLLRQQGFHVFCDGFNRFRNLEGKFKESLLGDVRGMLSLFEAAHFRVHGEEILDEALTFTATHLDSILPYLNNFLATQVNKALEMPIHKTLTRLGARRYMLIYQQDESHNKALLNFSKLDFNMLQKMHQKELSGLTKWWKQLNCAKNLPFARDRLVECYFWILGVYFEPKYSLARKFCTKVIALASIMDDMYDVHGTLDELILFTDVIERWDINAIDQLPPYMCYFYRALMDVYSEMEVDLAREGKQSLVNYAKLEMKKLARAYFQEAYWFHNGYLPTSEEYMNVALISSGYIMMATTSLVGMGELGTEEALNWITGKPLIVKAAAIIARLMDDMAGHEAERERGDVASAVECHMNQYGVSKEEAFRELKKNVTNAWKNINKECLKPTAVAKPILDRVVNLARVIDLLYKEGDCYTNSTSKSKEFITRVLVNPAT